MSDPTNAATTSRNEIDTASSPGNSPSKRDKQTADESAEQAQSQVPPQSKPFAVPSDDEPGQASTEQPYGDPNYELVDRRHGSLR